MNNKIICFVMHGLNCENRYENVMSTWGKDIDIVFFSDYENEKKKIFQSTYRTDYGGLEEKIVEGLKLLYNKFPYYEWYFICDDDTFVNTDKLVSELDNFDKEKIYGKLLIHYWNNEEIRLLSGGGGTLVSNQNMKLIVDNLKNYGLGIADVSLGITIKKLNIKIENFELFVSDTPQTVTNNKSEYKNFITFHSIKNFEQMNEIYKNINL